MVSLKSKLFIILLVLTAVGIGTTINFYRQLSELKNNPQISIQKEVKSVVAEISKIMILPVGEDPTVATVADPEKLKGQSFFANAKKDDKVLIYTNAKKAILYRPSERKIVEVAPLNIGQQAP